MAVPPPLPAPGRLTGGPNRLAQEVVHVTLHRKQIRKGTPSRDPFIPFRLLPVGIYRGRRPVRRRFGILSRRLFEGRSSLMAAPAFPCMNVGSSGSLAASLCQRYALV